MLALVGNWRDNNGQYLVSHTSRALVPDYSGLDPSTEIVRFWLDKFHKSLNSR
jgi:hypothetical protein